MNEFTIKAKIDNKDVEITIAPADLDKLYDKLIAYRNEQDNTDGIIRKAVVIAIENGKVSTELLQRKLRIGYGRAASIIDELENKGVVGPAQGGNTPRSILISSIDEYTG